MNYSNIVSSVYNKNKQFRKACNLCAESIYISQNGDVNDSEANYNDVSFKFLQAIYANSDEEKDSILREIQTFCVSLKLKQINNNHLIK